MLGDDHSVLCEIRDFLGDIRSVSKVRPNIEKIEQISATNCFILDYKDRYHVLIWSPNTITLTLEDLGTMTVTQYTWTDISFQPGTRIFAQNQSTLIPVLIRCTDFSINVPGGGSSGGGTSSSFGSNFPSVGTAIGASDGTSMQNLLVESSSNKNLRIAIYQAGTEAGVTANGLKVDGTAVIQPVTGTVTANLGTLNGAALDSTLTGGSAQERITDGTNVANVLKSDGTSAGQNALLQAGTFLSTGTLTLTSGAPATLWYDLANYPWLSVEVLTNSSAATLTFQTSGDGSQTNVRTTGLFDSQTTVGSSTTSTTSAAASLSGPRTGRYFRISSNVAGGNTVTLVLTFYTMPTTPLYMGVAALQNGTWTVQPGNTPNTSAWLMQDVVAASNGEVGYHNLTAASTNFTNTKAVACQMYSYTLSNTSASVIYVKFYDKATAPGTGDTPKRTVQVPANSTIEKTISKGLRFTTGFGWGTTGLVADNDNTAIAANCVVDFDLNS